MERITVSLGERSYPISIGAGLFDDPAHLSFLSNPNSSAKQKVVVISNVTVAPIYAEKILSTLAHHAAKRLCLNCQMASNTKA
ncbi:3-dehydroquinate synthase [Vibrio ponticus]|nr:3-dehydroquinate synthase [Vibrio ponticus]